MTVRTVAAAVAALTAAACSPSFDPPSEVKGFRLLAIRASPPEIAPADDPDPAQAHAAALDTLIASPAFLAERDRRAVVLHVACTPEPGNAAESPCTALTQLADPTGLLAAGLTDEAACTAPGVGKVNAITFSGVETCGLAGCGPVSVPLDPGNPGVTATLAPPRYALPADFTFSSLPPGDPGRILGLEAVDLALALDVDPAALAPTSPVASDCEALQAFAARFLAAWPGAAHVTALKRIVIRGPEARNAANRNPAVAGVTYDAGVEPWPRLTLPGAPTPTALRPGAHVELLPDTTGDDVERYLQIDASGAIITEKDEDRAWSWFSTGGKLKYDHTTRADEKLEFKPGAGPALMWLVVRDLRGGLAWTVAEVKGE